MSQPTPPQAVLRQAEHLGRRHGKAAVYWQIGEGGSRAALEFYHYLLRGGAAEVTGLFEMPGLDGRRDYDRDNLAADLGLARDAPVLAEAAEVYLAAAREEFWLEAARLARRRLQASGSRTAGEAGDRPQDITDPATGLSRLLSARCSTCILRHGDKMHLGTEHTARFVRQALDAGTYVVCHQTLTYGAHPDFGPAICRGFFDAYANSRELHQPGVICEVCPRTKGRNEVPTADHPSFVTWDYAMVCPSDARFACQPGKIIRADGPPRLRLAHPGPARERGGNLQVRRQDGL